MHEATPIRINSNLVKWAREHRKLSSKVIAEKIKLSISEYEKIEKVGIVQDLSRFEKLADSLKFPTAAFFLAEPPPEKMKLPDFRLLRDANSDWSFAFTRVLDQVEEINEEMGQLHKILNLRVLPELNFHSLGEEPEVVAKKFRKLINISFEEQLDLKMDMFSTLRSRIEMLNIYVLKIPFPREDAIGFSHFETANPSMIVMNSNGGTYERNFTVLHEVGHILLKISGVCIPRVGTKGVGAKGNVERWCNRFATEVLLPREDIEREKMLKLAVEAKNLDFIFKARKNYKASGEALIFRMADLGFIKFKEAAELVEKYQEKFKKELSKKKKKNGATYYTKIIAQLGKRYVGLVSQAKNKGKISSLRAANALGVKIDNIPNLQKALVS